MNAINVETKDVFAEMVAGLDDKRAWVVFTDQSELKSVRYLRRGFRHCFVIIHDGHHWISIDPMANYMDVMVHDQMSSDFDFVQWLEERGHAVIQAKLTRNIMVSAPVMFFTCVEACKRILGVHKLSVFTPWQLYRYLTKQSCSL